MTVRLRSNYVGSLRRVMTTRWNVPGLCGLTWLSRGRVNLCAREHCGPVMGNSRKEVASLEARSTAFAIRCGFRSSWRVRMDTPYVAKWARSEDSVHEQAL